MNQQPEARPQQQEGELVRLRRVCAWCGLVMDEGSPGAMVTHGICEPCNRQLQHESNLYLEDRA